MEKTDKPLPDHLTWLLERWGSAFKSALEDEGVTLNKGIEIFFDADPTQGKKLVDWLIRSYCGIAKDNISTTSSSRLERDTKSVSVEAYSEVRSDLRGFRWEDIQAGAASKVYSTLQAFVEHRGKLEPEARNINRYRNLADVWQSISLFEKKKSSASKRSLKREEREKMLAETRLLFRSPDMIVAVPLSKQASQWWGRGTRWCTAATKEEGSNLFWTYHIEAPLFVLTFPQRLLGFNNSNDNGEAVKLQFWVGDDSFQFMDEADNEVNPEIIEQNWQVFEPFFEWALGRNSEILKYFPRKKITTEHIISYFTSDDDKVNLYEWTDIIDELPEDRFTSEVCKILAQTSSSFVKYFPQNKINQEIIDIMVRSGEHLIDADYILPKFRNKQFYQWAVEKEMVGLKDVPKRWLDQDMYFHAVKGCGGNISMVPKRFRNTELYMHIARFQPNFITSIPKEFRTSDIINQAVSSKPSIISILSPDEITREVALIALKKQPNLIERVPHNIVDENFLKEVARYQGSILKYISPDKITNDLVEIAVENWEWGIEFLPREKVTQQMAERLVKENNASIFAIPECFRTREMYLLALKNNVSCIVNINQELVNRSFIEECIAVDVKCFKYFAHNKIDYSLFLTALKSDVSNIEFIPSHLQDRIPDIVRELPYSAKYLPSDVLEAYSVILIPNWGASELDNLEILLNNNPPEVVHSKKELEDRKSYYLHIDGELYQLNEDGYMQAFKR